MGPGLGDNTFTSESAIILGSGTGWADMVCFSW